MGSKPLQLKFVQSATRVHQLPELGPEVAFVGRSNVGKSSLINALAHQRQLARVSNTPGRTQLINVFLHVAGGAVVDLPGYGYAKVPGHIRGDWSSMIEGYLLEREEPAKEWRVRDFQERGAQRRRRCDGRISAHRQECKASLASETLQGGRV